MKMLKRELACLLVLTSLGLNIPKVAFCENLLLIARADKKQITWHAPKIMTTPEKDIPMIKLEEKKQTGKIKYLWIGLGAAVVLALVAGGGGGGGGGDTPTTEGSGNISVGW